MKWFRFYHEAYRDPKVQDLPPPLFRFWINFLCVASESDPRGEVASEAHLRRALGLNAALVSRYCRALESFTLVTRRDTGALVPHNWYERQRESDDAAIRKRQSRAKTSGNGPAVMSRDTSRDENVTLFAEREGEVFPEGNTTEREGDAGAPATEPPPPSLFFQISPNEKHPEPKPKPEPGPEFTALGNLAIEMSADLSMGAWVLNMARLGHTAPAIRFAIEEGAAAGKWSHKYLLVILKRIAVQGLPPPPAPKLNNGRPDHGAKKPEDPDFVRRRAEFIRRTARLPNTNGHA